MRRTRMGFGGVAVAAAVLFAGTAVIAAPGGSQWISAGGDLQNTRSQPSETKLNVGNVGSLTQKWAFTTGGDVSATPAVDGNTVYVPDWAGNLYAINKNTGQQIWKVSIAAASGVPFDKARATPAVSGNKVIIGTQGSILVPGGGPGGKILAFDKTTGALLWSTVADFHPASIITQSATVFDGRVYVGVASQEEALAGFVPGYPCCSFRGSMLALDLETGQILWKTSLAPSGYSGNAVWGSSPAVDAKRGQLYIATGNNYSVPQTVLDCVAAASPGSGGHGGLHRTRQPLRLDHGARSEDRGDPLGHAGDPLRRVDGQLPAAAVRRRLQLPGARRARLRLRSSPGDIQRQRCQWTLT